VRLELREGNPMGSMMVLLKRKEKEGKERKALLLHV
jgi:hypothetical protein